MYAYGGGQWAYEGLGGYMNKEGEYRESKETGGISGCVCRGWTRPGRLLDHFNERKGGVRDFRGESREADNGRDLISPPGS